jgi:hypothetical protein
VSEPRKIILTEEDFGPAAAPPAEPASPAPHDTRATADPLPPVSRRERVSIGAAAAAKARPGGGHALLHDERTSGLIAAAIGMALAWGITEVSHVLDIHVSSKTGVDAVTALWTSVIALVYASVVVGFDRAVGGAWPEAWRRAARTALPALAIGFAAGFVASVIYLEIVESIFEKSGFIGEHDARIYVARALGWMIFGAGVGVIMGITERSRAKAVNGLLGGLGGGALGGLLFQFTIALFDSGGLSRLVGLLGIGLLVAAAMRAVELARRESWLRIVGGGMTGKEFILYHPVTHIGSAPECEIFLLKDPQVAPRHARIEDRGSERLLHSTAGSPVRVNDAAIASCRLRAGDLIQIGNSTIAYSERHVAAGRA